MAKVDQLTTGKPLAKIAVMTLLSKKEFAEVCGVSKQYIGKLVKNGKIPTTPDGYIDTGADECLTYMKSKGVNISELAMRDPAPVKSSTATMPPPRAPSAAGRVVNRQELEMAKLEADTDYRRLQAAKLEGDMVSRDVFERRIWGPTETFCQRILSDGAKTIATKAIQMARAGYEKSDKGESFTEPEILQVVMGEISTHLKKFVDAMTRSKQKDAR